MYADRANRSVQSDLSYPATSGPEHIRISDLGRIWEICLTQQVQ